MFKKVDTVKGSVIGDAPTNNSSSSVKGLNVVGSSTGSLASMYNLSFRKLGQYWARGSKHARVKGLGVVGLTVGAVKVR